MRISRIISGLVAFALIGLLPMAAPATAAESHAGAARVAPSATQDAKASRRIGIHINEPRRNKFVIRGKVAPRYQGRNLIVQRKDKGDKRWSKFKTVKTNRQSTYRTQVAERQRVGRVFYRVKSSKTDTFKASYSGRVYIRTFRA